MAYRRSIVSRASLLSRIGPTTPLFPYTHPENDHKRRQHPLFGSAVNSPSQSPFARQHQLLFLHGANNMFSARNMSTAVGDKTEFITDIAADVASSAGDVAAVSAGPGMSEVAIAAADSAFPVAALQYFIEGVHNFTGCNWWASIALTTLLIRGATVPLLINQLKSTTKLSMLRPQLDEIKEEMQGKGMDPDAVADGQKRMQALFKQYGVTPFTPLKGLLFQGPVFLSFFLAISNMVEKVPSFKQGGAFWFTDLSTPDSLYIFPALTALSFLITVECNMQEGMEGNPAAKTMKKVSRVFAAVTIPITMNFPKALFCYWVTSNMFSLMYGLVLKAPGVKQFLKIPIIPVAPSSNGKSSSKPEFSFIEAMKQYVAAKQNATKQLATSPQHATSAQQATSLLSTTSKPAGIQNVPSSSVLSQRLHRLERQVKAKKKNKKR